MALHVASRPLRRRAFGRVHRARDPAPARRLGRIRR
jgi:hypothetical protein